jgi:hypothetical protein
MLLAGARAPPAPAALRPLREPLAPLPASSNPRLDVWVSSLDRTVAARRQPITQLMGCFDALMSSILTDISGAIEGLRSKINVFSRRDFLRDFQPVADRQTASRQTLECLESQLGLAIRGIRDGVFRLSADTSHATDTYAQTGTERRTKMEHLRAEGRRFSAQLQRSLDRLSAVANREAEFPPRGMALLTKFENVQGKTSASVDATAAQMNQFCEDTINRARDGLANEVRLREQDGNTATAALESIRSGLSESFDRFSTFVNAMPHNDGVIEKVRHGCSLYLEVAEEETRVQTFKFSKALDEMIHEFETNAEAVGLSFTQMLSAVKRSAVGTSGVFTETIEKEDFWRKKNYKEMVSRLKQFPRLFEAEMEISGRYLSELFAHDQTVSTEFVRSEIAHVNEQCEPVRVRLRSLDEIEIRISMVEADHRALRERAVTQLAAFEARIIDTSNDIHAISLGFVQRADTVEELVARLEARSASPEFTWHEVIERRAAEVARVWDSRIEMKQTEYRVIVEQLQRIALPGPDFSLERAEVDQEESNRKAREEEESGDNRPDDGDQKAVADDAEEAEVEADNTEDTDAVPAEEDNRLLEPAGDEEEHNRDQEQPAAQEKEEEEEQNGEPASVPQDVAAVN